jgi:sarcosine oxidase
VRALLRQFLPLADGELRASATCLYTNTPDRDFLIDFHPDHSRVILVSPCSGHGFKFASAIGEVVAELVVRGRSTADLAPFRLERFGSR